MSGVTISHSDHAVYGCPYCGERRHFERAAVPGGCLLLCAACNVGYVVAEDGRSLSPFGFEVDGRTVYPAVVPHPLASSSGGPEEPSAGSAPAEQPRCPRGHTSDDPRWRVGHASSPCGLCLVERIEELERQGQDRERLVQELGRRLRELETRRAAS